MRILYYHRTLADGAEGIHIKEIVNCFRAMGHEVRVISIVGDSDEASIAKSNSVVNRMKQVVGSGIRKLLPGIIYELAEILANFPAKRLLNRTIREFKPDFIYERYSNYGYAASTLAVDLGIPIILEVNVPYYHYKKEWERLYFPKLLKRVEAQIMERVDHIIVVSTPLKKILLEYKLRDNKITVMPNGVNLAHFNTQECLPVTALGAISDAQVVLGFVGAIRKWHRMENLIEILHEIDLQKYQAKFLVVGECSYLEELQAYVDNLGLHNQVIFTDRVAHERIPGYIAAMDIAISPHAVAYSSPMKILEYMALGKCVIAPDMENIRDLIEPDQTGLLFNSDNETDLRDKLLYALENKSSRERIGQSAALAIQQHYRWDKNAHDVIEIVESIRKSAA